MVAKKTNGSTKANVASGELRGAAAHPPVGQPDPGVATKPVASSDAASRAGKLPGNVAQAMKNLGIESSDDIDERHLKILFWGATSTRKTETVLRNFPNVLLIDTEGNSDMCARNKAIPTFARVKTQDSRKVVQILDAAAKGQIRMPNGDPIQTICIDSVSVLWGVQQEVAASLAEQRAAGRNKPIEEAGTTPLDWGKAKRPLKAVLNRFAKGAIPLLVLIAREKDLFEEGSGGELKKIGLQPDMVKNTDYEMNVALHFMWESRDKKKWSYQVTKVQGVLGEIFPDGSIGTAIPFDKLWEYTSELKPVVEDADGEDETLPDQIASGMIREMVEHTQANLIKYATEKGFTAAELGGILKAAGFKGFEASRWDAMIQAVDKAFQNGENLSGG